MQSCGPTDARCTRSCLAAKAPRSRSSQSGPNLFHQPVDRFGNTVLDLPRPAESGAAVFIKVEAPLIPPFLPDATRRDVRDHVVRVAADPGPRAELLLEPEGI